MLQECDVDLLFAFPGLTPPYDPRNLLRLPVNHARNNECQATTRVHLVVQFADTDPPPSPIIDVAGQRVQLLDLEQALPDA